MYRRRRVPILLSPVMIILYIMVILVAVVYFGIAFLFFDTHYLPNTKVGNIECGMKTPEYVVQKNEGQTARYSILITDRLLKTYVIEGKSFNYTYVNLGEEAEILEKQNPLLWPVALFKPQTYSLSYSVDYDNEKLEEQISRLGLFVADYMTAPTDAYIEMTEDGYKIIPETMGNTAIYEQVKKEICDAVASSATTHTLSPSCYVTPQVYSSSEVIISAANTLDNYMKAVITYDIEGYEESFTKEMILSALQLDSDYQISIKTDVITRYVQSLATKYNTYADKREFKTAKGDTVIIGGGDYGWVVDKAKEEAEILKNLTSGAPVTREPIWSQTAKVAGPNDIGNTYVEIDYTNQTLYYFKEGEMVFTSKFVSGNIKKGWASPDGVYDINYKDCSDYRKGQKIELKGEDYSSKVDYFIVWARNIGFHDASWRKDKEFGGTTYLKDGSHGCINMPLNNVKQLFSLVSNGTPIVAYYREPVQVFLHEYAYSYVKPETTTKTVTE